MIIDYAALFAKQHADIIAGVREVVRTEMAAREAERILDDGSLAKLLGISRRALQARLSRGSELANIATRLDGRRVWRKSDVEALVARGGAGKLGASSTLL
jgi:hypothetical protein